MEMNVLLFVLGLLGGFVSGLLGIGGGIIMVPLLLYIPPALGAGVLGMKLIAGITSVQSFVGAVSGAAGHHRFRRINYRLAILMGGSMAISSLLGSVASKDINENIILMVFAGMALAAAVMMFVPKPEEADIEDAQQVSFNSTLAVISGLILGSLSGIIGQGGAFLFLPVMFYILKIPTMVAIGSALVIGIATSVSVLIGRMSTAQIPYFMSLVIVAGVVVGAQLGSIVSQKTPRKTLRRVLAVLITVTAAKIWFDLLFV